METASLWKTFGSGSNYPQLSHKLETEVVVIGGGICGVTCAELLSDAGIDVILLEASRIGESSTANSTGNLYEVYGELLKEGYQSFGDKIGEVVKSRREAINLIEENIRKYQIDCDFKRVSWNYYSAIEQKESQIQKCLENAQKLNIPLRQTTSQEDRLKSRKSVTIEGQAQFNPVRYVQGLAKAIQDRCRIFEESRVIDIQNQDNLKRVLTDDGAIRCKFVIHATHTPKGFMPVQAMMGPYREYGIACRIKEPQHPEGIFFGYHAASEITSTRTYERNGEHFLIVVGEPHKVGQGDTLLHMKRLEKFAAEHFDVLEITHRWGGQHYRPADHLPYIGRRKHGSDTLIATGFSTHGLVYGTLSAMIFKDIVQGRDNPYIKLFDPARFSPVRSAPKFLKENLNVFNQYLKDYLRKNDDAFTDIALGEGKVVEFDGHKLAAFRSEENQLQVCSAVCTHLGCIVHWNNGENSWDCPCHGSRFSPEGEVIEGPALKALARLEELTQGKPVMESAKINLESLGGAAQP